MMLRTARFVTLAVVVSVVPVSAQETAQTLKAGSGVAARTTALKAGQLLIKGTAQDTNQTPLPRVRLRLRNLSSNRIDDATNANVLGEFTFAARADVPYIVEIADDNGRVVAVSDVITAQAGDVASTIVTVPAKLPNMTGMFADSASAILLAATGTGITVLPFVSPER